MRSGISINSRSAYLRPSYSLVLIFNIRMHRDTFACCLFVQFFENNYRSLSKRHDNIIENNIFGPVRFCCGKLNRFLICPALPSST